MNICRDKNEKWAKWHISTKEGKYVMVSVTKNKFLSPNLLTSWKHIQDAAGKEDPM